MFHVGVKHQNLVLHSAWHSDKPVFGLGQITDHGRAEIVVVVAVRKGRDFLEHYSRCVVVLTVVVGDIGHETALLKHITAAGQIIRPCLRLVGPGLVTVEPLAVFSETESRDLVVNRLVR